MKNKIYYLLLLFISMGMYACSSDTTAFIPDPLPESFDDDGIAPDPTTEKTIKIIPTQTHQEIDGFGCAFAEWSHRIYNNTKRIEVLEALFSDKGLGLTIFRGEAFPHYGNDDGTYDFGLDQQFNRAANDPYLLGCYWDNTSIPVRLGQMWLVNELTSNPKKYKVDKFMFSTWSPPGYMKTSGKPEGGSILDDKKKDFAHYLADFVKSYEDRFNFKIYAISPTNEPNTGYGSWSVCSWSASSLANFIVDDLKPALTDLDLDTKIVLGEHSWWSSGNNYINNAMEANPQVTEVSHIAAGHGYFTSDSSIEPYNKAAEAGLRVWNTELSDTDNKNTDWVEDGMKWAKTFESYLTLGNVNAIVWWAGARPALNNEPLIYLEEALPSTDFELTPRYYAFGHYTKFIPEGSIRTDIGAALLGDSPIDTRTDEESGEEVESIFPEGLSFSSYIHPETQTFTIVAINKTKEMIESVVEIEGEEIENMRTYTSSKDVKWMYKKINPSLSGQRSVMIPAEGIITITGKFK